jgi:hypothetical protein
VRGGVWLIFFRENEPDTGLHHWLTGRPFAATRVKRKPACFVALVGIFIETG